MQALVKHLLKNSEKRYFSPQEGKSAALSRQSVNLSVAYILHLLWYSLKSYIDRSAKASLYVENYALTLHYST